jgi:hypothetical protein
MNPLRNFAAVHWLSSEKNVLTALPTQPIQFLFRQFLVVGDGEEWTVKTETQALGCYTDRVRAIAAAIDLAEAEAKRETAHRW